MPYSDPEQRKKYQKEYRRRPSAIKARSRRYILANETIKAQRRDSYHRHRKEINQQRRKSYKKNRKKIIAQVTAYYFRNKIKIYARQRIWAQNHREKIKVRQQIYNKQYYQKNKRKISERIRKYVKNNPHITYAKIHRYRTQKKELGGSFTAKEWLDVQKKQKGICMQCKKSKKLSVDHIIPVTKWTEWALAHKPLYKCNDIKNIQGLCQPCNATKSNKIY